MKKISTTFFISLLVLIITSCSGEDESISKNAKTDYKIAEIQTNVSYGPDPAQTYDLYLPANRSTLSTKILVIIHGGSWIQGDKNDMQTYIPLLQKSHPDHAIVNLNYRLAVLQRQAAFPNQFLDLQRAFQKLSKDADDLGIKAEFGLIGASAGGHLALQYDNVYDSQDQVKMVCSIVGPTDFTDAYYTENPSFNFALKHLIDENAYPGIIDYAQAVSPAHFISTKSSATILFYGDKDNLVPISNGKLLKEKLDAAGVTNSFTVYEGGHGNWEDEDNGDMQLQLSDFIDTHLPIDN